MLMGRLCHASMVFGIRSFGSTLGLASEAKRSLADEIPENYENRSNAEKCNLTECAIWGQVGACVVISCGLCTVGRRFAL